MFERTYLFNPFMLQTSDNDELSREIDRLAQKYKYNDDTMGGIIYNINLESDLLTIYGEFIARYQKDYELLKLSANNRRDKAMYQLRKDWASTSNEKPPAMSYFEAQAEDLVSDERTKQIQAESMLTRFKNAYKSLETKQNALKKSLEAFKYE